MANDIQPTQKTGEQIGDQPLPTSAAGLSETEMQQIVAGLTIKATQLALTVPPPEVIEGYLKFYPDAAQKFFQWAEAESSHRREMDRKLINSQVEDSRRGMTYGLIVSFAGLTLAAFATWMHEPWVAGIIGGGTLVSLARAFIVGKNLILRHSKRKNPEKN